MTTFRLLWEIHKWIGIVLGLVLIMSAVTGALLLLKKEYHWIQPSTQRGTEGPAEKLAPIHEVYKAIFALNLPEFQSEEDIDRIDFRPGKRVHKVRSVHGNLEVQVDAISTAILGDVNIRRSDWLETIHDGNFFGEFVHDYIMVIVAVATVVLALSGYMIWLWPKILKRRARKKRAA